MTIAIYAKRSSLPKRLIQAKDRDPKLLFKMK